MDALTGIFTCINNETAARRPRLDTAGAVTRAASVLLLVIPGRSGPELLFEVRSSKLAWQPGDVCFPGGRREDSDRNFAAAAIREACEELGVTESEIRLCGTLDFFAAHNGYMIYPFAGICRRDLEGFRNLACNKAEVAELFSVPLKYLIENPPAVGTTVITSTRGKNFPMELMPPYASKRTRVKEVPVYFYSYEGHVIWGMTAAILHSFIERFGKELGAFA